MCPLDMYTTITKQLLKTNMAQRYKLVTLFFQKNRIILIGYCIGEKTKLPH